MSIWGWGWMPWSFQIWLVSKVRKTWKKKLCPRKSGKMWFFGWLSVDASSACRNRITYETMACTPQQWRAAHDNMFSLLKVLSWFLPNRSKFKMSGFLLKFEKCDSPKCVTFNKEYHWYLVSIEVPSNYEFPIWHALQSHKVTTEVSSGKSAAIIWRIQLHNGRKRLWIILPHHIHQSWFMILFGWASSLQPSPMSYSARDIDFAQATCQIES